MRVRFPYFETEAKVLTARDEEILMTVCHKVRALSLEQVAAVWWKGKRDVANKRLAQLRDEGWVDYEPILSHPVLQLDLPLVIWKPGNEEPDLGAAAWKLSNRWTDVARRTMAVTGTDTAAARLGGYAGRRLRASEASHDLSLAQVYLNLTAREPARAKGWFSEAQLYAEGEGRGDRLPDAMVRTRREKTVIEFGGGYSKKKLEEFHRYCRRRQLAYDLL